MQVPLLTQWDQAGSSTGARGGVGGLVPEPDLRVCPLKVMLTAPWTFKKAGLQLGAPTECLLFKLLGSLWK